MSKAMTILKLEIDSLMPQGLHVELGLISCKSVPALQQLCECELTTAEKSAR